MRSGGSAYGGRRRSASPRQHAYLLHLLGVRQVAVAVNKMDLVDYDQTRFTDVASDIADYLGELGIKPAFIVPTSARDGGNIASAAEAMPWYTGPSILEALDRFHGITAPLDQPLRLPIQDVYKFDQRRIIAGRIESGVLQVGDRLLFSPSNKVARVRSIEAWNADPAPVAAQAGGPARLLHASLHHGIADRDLTIGRHRDAAVADHRDHRGRSNLLIRRHFRSFPPPPDRG